MKTKKRKLLNDINSDVNRISKKAYKQGVKDSLRILFTHITSIEHGVGFAASQKADDYVEIMKQIYGTIDGLYK